MRSTLLKTLLLGGFALSIMQPAGAATIGFDPVPPLAVENGLTYEVDVVVSDLGGDIVSAYDVDIAFDDSLLQVDAVVFSDELGDVGAFEALTDDGLLGPGLLDAASVSLLSDAELGAIQDGLEVTLFTIEFTAIGTGDAALDFSWDPFNDVKGPRNEQIIPPAEVPVPEPGTLALLTLGLIGIGVARRRRMS